MYFSTNRPSATDCDSWNGSDAASTAGLLEQINSRSFASLDQIFDRWSEYETLVASAVCSPISSCWRVPAPHAVTFINSRSAC